MSALVRRRTIWLVCGLAVVAVILFSPFVTWFWATEAPAVSLAVAPLTAGLSGTWQAMSDELDRRVKASFPIGSLAAEMEARLQQQGFFRRGSSALAGQEHVVVRSEKRFPCATLAFVLWQVDSEGRLTSVRGDYPMGQCL